ncbi:MAG: hypothetical protein JW902_10020 [Syntrophaceae bacterium]|nr:hypothetical protein [Syntrophaceae bacterium]
MSIILDSLKKLEQETAARKEGKNKISEKILQPDLPKPKYKGIVLLSIAAALGGAVIAVVFIAGFSGLMKPVAPVAAAPSKVSQSAVLTEPKGVTQSPEVAPMPVQDRRPDIQIDKMRPPAEKAENKGKKEIVKSVLHEGKDARSENRIPEVSETVPGISLPRMTVSGIIWQEERQARRAFINNIIVDEGSVVEGCRIEEIYPNRIRFSKGAQSFEISMDK